MLLFSRACQVFLDLAYPEGPGTIPPRKRAYYELSPNTPWEKVLPPAPLASGICEKLPGSQIGFTFRLGSSQFPHLKLKIQEMPAFAQMVLVYAVDTHDAYSDVWDHPPADHPDYAGWIELQRTNRLLKERIEQAWEEAGILTLNSLLRKELALHESPP